MGVELFVLSEASTAVSSTETTLLHHDYLSASCRQLSIDAGCHCVLWAVAAPPGHDLADGCAHFIRPWRMIGPLIRAADNLSERISQFAPNPGEVVQYRGSDPSHDWTYLYNRHSTLLRFVQRYLDAVYTNPHAYVAVIIS